MYLLGFSNNQLLHSLGAVSWPLLFFLLLLILFVIREIIHRRRYTSLQKDYAGQLLQEQQTHEQIRDHLEQEAQEQTRDHIAKELHAGCGNTLALISFKLSYLSGACHPELKEEVRDTKGLVKALLSEIRQIGAALNTDHIAEIGFLRALERELDNLEKRGSYRVEFSVTGEPRRLFREQEVMLFRYCQEILDNVAKHANPTVVTVGLNYLSERIMLTISDNGTGFDKDRVIRDSAARSSTGLTNIQKRAKMLNGRLAMKSRIGEGTSFTIDIPHNS